MKKYFFLLLIFLLSQGCVSFHNEYYRFPVLGRLNKNNIQRKKLLIINQFENNDPENNDPVPEPDVMFFKNMTHKFYSDLDIFEISKDALGNPDYSAYDYVIINRLNISKNQLHGCLKTLVVIGLSWMDRRTFYLNSVFKDMKKNIHYYYTAEVSYHKITNYLFPWFKIWGKTEYESKKDSFNYLNTLVFNRIVYDHF